MVDLVCRVVGSDRGVRSSYAYMDNWVTRRQYRLRDVLLLAVYFNLFHLGRDDCYPLALRSRSFDLLQGGL